mmetsp:Transcript_46342/g.108585  ORF Transcript_46342/g.108585 Transcript_46342/m.108585 type:complete len:226 (-) Transcript_46342:314-991(-)
MALIASVFSFPSWVSSLRAPSNSLCRTHVVSNSLSLPFKAANSSSVSDLTDVNTLARLPTSSNLCSHRCSVASIWDRRRRISSRTWPISFSFKCSWPAAMVADKSSVMSSTTICRTVSIFFSTRRRSRRASKIPTMSRTVTFTTSRTTASLNPMLWRGGCSAKARSAKVSSRLRGDNIVTLAKSGETQADFSCGLLLAWFRDDTMLFGAVVGREAMSSTCLLTNA